jgi:ABC-type glycerol-3-phosphate transport system substrate-binding protein
MLNGFARSRQGGEEAPLGQLGHPGAISRRTFVRAAAGATAAAGLGLARPAIAERRAVTLTGLARDYTLRLDSPWRSAGAELERRHPERDITLELEGSPYNDQRRKALLSTQAGQEADIIQMDSIWLGEFAEGGMVSSSWTRTARGSAAVTWTCRAA